MEATSDYGAFVNKFILQLNSSPDLPLNSLTFSVKDMFDVEGYVTGFGSPDWLRTHEAATSTAPLILTLLKAGAICVGTNVTDELAYSIIGRNAHYGTPINPLAPDRVPGGSSSGSVVAVAAKLVDFSIGTDCIGSARVPASHCGVFGIRPSHGLIPKSGSVSMAPSLDAVGWFARDPVILGKVGRVLLQLPEIAPARPTHIIIAKDCFKLSSIPYNIIAQPVIKAIEKLYGGDVLKDEIIGDYVKTNVPSLQHFLSKENSNEVDNIPSLAALSNAMQLLARYEFKNTHSEWISAVKPNLGPGISETIAEVLKTTGENIDICHSIKGELRDALTTLLGDFGVLMIPTVSGPPPKIETSVFELKDFIAKTFTLSSVGGFSGCCQISIPLGMYDNLPISISLVVRHGADGFLLSLVESIYESIKEEATRPST